jgi:hypothetical protein
MTPGHHGRRPRRLVPIRPRLVPLEDRAVPSVTTPADPPEPPLTATAAPATVTPIVAIGAEVGNRPAVRVIDSVTGQTRFAFEAYESSFRGGVRVATGDVNGDGVLDLVTAPGVGGGPLIKIFDGTTGSMIGAFLAYDAGFRGGVHVAVGDVNGDGFADIITGAGDGGGPHVRVFNGAWAAPQVRILPMTTETVPTAAEQPPETTVEPPVANEGEAPAAPDGGVTTTGDGTTTEPEPIGTTTTVSDEPITPPAPVIDTWTPVLTEFMAYGLDFRGGVRVAAGDVTGDGRADIITGAGVGGGPHVRIYDGTTGQIYREFMAFASPFTGGVYVTAGDIDGDGRAEVAVGAGVRGSSRVHVYSGSTGALQRVFQADPSKPINAVRVRLVDFDNDGRMDLLAGVGQRLQVRDARTGNSIRELAPFDGGFINGFNVG